MKVFVMTDLEGVAGVATFLEQAYPEGKYYEAARRLLTAEVNAGVEGLLAGGAGQIVVMDGHGPGAVVFEELHPAAELIHGRPLSPLWREELDGCGAAIFIGQHAMAGVAMGNLNHTQNSLSIDYVKLNGEKIGEIAQFALLAGSYDVPVIFLSGDEAACREIEGLIPGVTTASVKRGLNRTSAISISAQEARRRIRAGVQEALVGQMTRPLRPLRWDGPYLLEKRYFASDMTDPYRSVPGVEWLDSQTVRLRGDDLRALLYA